MRQPFCQDALDIIHSLPLHTQLACHKEAGVLCEIYEYPEAKQALLGIAMAEVVMRHESNEDYRNLEEQYNALVTVANARLAVCIGLLVTIGVMLLNG